MTTNIEKIRAIAFYLPQYHPIPENDRWWGKGFTEWTNVAQARPLFPGHYQPHIPADLGFYDLRLEETRIAQAELARKYGIYGFCYYHYWFNGKMMLEHPFNEVRRSGKPNFPFCLCWANENWTRRWDGFDEEILMAQEYGSEDDIAHIHWLVNAFKDERYIRIDGKPLFLVYRASSFPDPRRTTDIWREEAAKSGISDLFLARVESNLGDYDVNPEESGFDAAVQFQPRWLDLGQSLQRNIFRRVFAKLGLGKTYMQNPYTQNWIYDYGKIVERMLQLKKPPYKHFSCVTPQWDNSPRRKINAVILHESTPELYGNWLEATIKSTLENNDDCVVFINAWNEWAEGNHLEPCRKWGLGYLEATRKILLKFKTN